MDKTETGFMKILAWDPLNSLQGGMRWDKAVILFWFVLTCKINTPKINTDLIPDSWTL